MRRARARTAASVALASLLAALAGGCGGGGQEGVTLKDGGTLKVKLTEFTVSPQRVDMKAGPDGVARLTLQATNDGAIPHDLAIGRGGYIIGRTTAIKPGQTAVAEGFELPPGTYRIFCTVSNHDVLGQYGFIVVK